MKKLSERVNDYLHELFGEYADHVLFVNYNEMKKHNLKDLVLQVENTDVICAYYTNSNASACDAWIAEFRQKILPFHAMSETFLSKYEKWRFTIFTLRESIPAMKVLNAFLKRVDKRVEHTDALNNFIGHVWMDVRKPYNISLLTVKLFLQNADPRTTRIFKFNDRHISVTHEILYSILYYILSQAKKIYTIEEILNRTNVNLYAFMDDVKGLINQIVISDSLQDVLRLMDDIYDWNRKR